MLALVVTIVEIGVSCAGDNHSVVVMLFADSGWGLGSKKCASRMARQSSFWQYALGEMSYPGSKAMGN